MIHSIDEFLAGCLSPLQDADYILLKDPAIAGVHGRLYARSSKPRRIGPIKYFNHYLFLDWDNDLFGQLEKFLVAQKSYSDYVNKEYKIPRSWRMTLPNLAMILISASPFDDKLISYALSTYFVPWQGGETGQLMLVDLLNQKMVCHGRPYYKQTGSIPLEYAVEELRSIILGLLPHGRCVRQPEK